LRRPVVILSATVARPDVAVHRTAVPVSVVAQGLLVLAAPPTLLVEQTVPPARAVLLARPAPQEPVYQTVAMVCAVRAKIVEPAHRIAEVHRAVRTIVK
jgi:hypothetical protein